MHDDESPEAWWVAQTKDHRVTAREPGRQRRGLTKAQARSLRRDATDPRHLFDWAQFHVVPRLYRHDPLSLVTTLNPRRSVADALFPRARQALLVLFFQHAENWFRQVDVVEVTRLGLGAAQRELKNLQLAGLLRARPVARERRRQFPSLEYQANQASPLFAPLQALASLMLHTPYAGPLRLPPDPDWLPDASLKPRWQRGDRLPSP